MKHAIGRKVFNNELDAKTDSRQSIFHIRYYFSSQFLINTNLLLKYSVIHLNFQIYYYKKMHFGYWVLAGCLFIQAHCWNSHYNQ